MTLKHGQAVMHRAVVWRVRRDYIIILYQFIFIRHSQSQENLICIYMLNQQEADAREYVGID